MKILVTGSLGYVGSVLVPFLANLGKEVIGFDSGLYSEARLETTPFDYLTVVRDLREISEEDLGDVDVVVHMAGLSNDPLGALSPSLTSEINLEATLRLATMARTAGVGRFVFLSTQSVYGIQPPEAAEMVESESDLEPVTEYAKTKLMAEHALAHLHSDDFYCIILRPATVFGYSPRFRSDIVFNNFVAQAFYRKTIILRSDGTPWRPVVHIQDLCQAIELATSLPQSVMESRTYNVGVRDENYTVADLADKAIQLVPGASLKFAATPTPDERSYKVSFDRIYDELGFVPKWTLQEGGSELLEKWSALASTEANVLGANSVRLDYLKLRLQEGSLDEALYRIQ